MTMLHGSEGTGATQASASSFRSGALTLAISRFSALTAAGSSGMEASFENGAAAIDRAAFQHGMNRLIEVAAATSGNHFFH
jgi:hypothetical protein